MVTAVLNETETVLVVRKEQPDPDGGGQSPDPRPWKITSYYIVPKKNWYGPPREAIGLHTLETQLDPSVRTVLCESVKYGNVVRIPWPNFQDLPMITLVCQEHDYYFFSYFIGDMHYTFSNKSH